MLNLIAFCLCFAGAISSGITHRWGWFSVDLIFCLLNMIPALNWLVSMK